MYNQTEAILAQYELEMKQTTKGRGSYICDTDKGEMALVSFRGSLERGEALKEYLENLKDLGFEVEQIYPNKEGKAVTKDEISGEKFLLKTHQPGVELDPSRWDDMKSAARLLGRYHTAAKKISDVVLPKMLQENGISVIENKKKHYRELIKIRNQIRTKKKKNDFERQFMEHCNPMIETAAHSIRLLEGFSLQTEDFLVCHGDYNHHNVIHHNGNWYMNHMESVTYSLPMEDMANYLRKMMEKNKWDTALGKTLIWEYNKEADLTERECEHLYALLLFPERFWKITNHYMNSHKAWVSRRDIEKLEKVIEQEQSRMHFMEQIFDVT